jgi:NAD(P) transhydrogenase subunit alpha
MTETSTVVLGVPRETFAGETRVALVPAVVSILSKSGIRVVVERGAGLHAGYPDRAFEEKGATLGSRDDVFASQIVACVRVAGANPGQDDRARIRRGQVIIGMADPLGEPELIPRITRGQAMDVLSSMATIAGYKAVLMAAEALPRMIPMMMTAAGTITPAKAFIVGAGVAGLQAIASAKRIGAVVNAYDVRPAVKEQIQSLGGKFVELPVEAGDAEDKAATPRNSARTSTGASAS